MIKREGNQYVLYAKKGNKVLGKHDSLQDALTQEKAIKISQARQKENDRGKR